ncbi:D-glycero-beta-D-manno-heptose 1,7-bisphosphate 7-phosphatase [Desulfobotulus alkaliphilus]|nr:D-glycero-beta-D-manno-heptose 1,7-bisphosphate 7-phosphatase [Desulfobotulus alkaliphilus]
MVKKDCGKGVVFLDRDGVINRDSPDYIRSVSDFHFIPGSAEAIGKLFAAGLDVILITNQSVINRGWVTEEKLSDIFQHLCQGVALFGGKIKDIFYCPHRPDEGCSCRKPGPGLFFQAEKKHGMDLSESIMVGDSAKDMQAAEAAGVGRKILVKTGNGQKDMAFLKKNGPLPDYLAEDLADAVDRILSGSVFSCKKY